MKKWIKERWLLVFNLVTFGFATCGFTLDVVQSELLFEQHVGRVVEKKMLAAPSTKGRVYDDPYVKVQWPDETRWVSAHTEHWLNLEVGDQWSETRPKDATALGWLRGAMILSWVLWSGGAAWFMTRTFES